jgi:hypothetical protein
LDNGQDWGRQYASWARWAHGLGMVRGHNKYKGKTWY